MGVERVAARKIDYEICPVCKKKLKEHLGRHIKKVHGERHFKTAIIRAKKEGMPDIDIGNKFGVTFNQLQSIITEEYGINISNVQKRKIVKRFYNNIAVINYVNHKMVY